MNVPSTVVADAAALAASRGIDGIVAIGGGSTLGLAKALALGNGYPIIAVPTTYAGSEMTPIYGITEDGRKKTGRDKRVLPQTVIYDPVLTETLPLEMSATSGLNAVAHAVEALYAPDTNPIVVLMAQEAIRAMASGLKGLGTSPTARSECLYAAWLAGAALGTTTMGLHHRICHVLGGKLNLPHAAMHAVVLPYVLRYNAAYIAPTLNRISIALGVGLGADVPHELRSLGISLGIPNSLSALGMGPERIDEITEELLESGAYVNPAPLQRAGLQKLLLSALHGDW
jgi:maleylacetate reductase